MASVSKRNWTYKGVQKSAFEVRYFEGGKQRSKSFARKKDADEFKRKVEREIHEGVHLPASEVIPIAEVAETYLRHCEDRLRDGRIGRVRYDVLCTSVRRSIITHLGARTFQNLAAHEVEAFYTHMVREEGLAPRTARDRVYMLKEIETLALKRGFAKRAPVSEGLKELKGIPSSRIKTFSAADVGRILGAIEGKRYIKSPRTTDLLHCACHLAAFCGLRFGEIMGLTLDSVSFERRILRIRTSLTRHDELKGPKTRAGIRDVPLPDQIADLIRGYIRDHYIENDRRLIFRSRTGTKIYSANFHVKLWQPLLERAGLGAEDRYHFHALRHFAASWMIEHGLPVTDVAMLLGHSKFDMTLQVYAHPIVGGSRRHDVMQAMASAIPVAATPRLSQELRDAP